MPGNLLLDSDYWDSVSEKIKDYHLEENVAFYKQREYIELIRNWSCGLEGKKILKTDLYEEAFGADQLLFWLIKKNAKIYGMDISFKITNKAKMNARIHSVYFKNSIVADVRSCSFRDESFDLIISNSTLDNLPACDVSEALSEFKRILKSTGILILTLDNAHNPLYLAGYYLGKLLNANKYYQDHCYTVKRTKFLVEQSNFFVQDVTAIVHIPTPFNRLAILLKKSNSVFMENLVKYCITLFAKLGKRKTKFLTGWFIALKLTKDPDSTKEYSV